MYTIRYKPGTSSSQHLFLHLRGRLLLTMPMPGTVLFKEQAGFQAADHRNGL